MLIGETRWRDFVEEISGEFEVFAPYGEGEYSYLSRFTPEGTMVLSGCRSTEPLKAFLYPPREQLVPLPPATRKRMIIGARNCDLAALRLLDLALMQTGDFVDPTYRAQRESTYIVALDCSAPLPTCHCDLMDLKPYPESGFDLALSPAGASLHVQAATAKGEEIFALLRRFASPAGNGGPASAAEIERNRRSTMAELAKQNAKYRKYRFQDKGVTGESWGDPSAKCVECGGCSYICPTCYCMVVNDETRTGEGFRKLRAWDSCQHSGYARVAGGATPRPRLWQRFRHRYHCKFLVMNENFSQPGCTGCGRCIAACPAGIDLRDVVSGL